MRDIQNMQLWQGRFESPLDAQVNDFNASIRIDKRMVKEDIGGSIAHATMLGACGIISKEDSELIVKTLSEMAEEIEKGVLAKFRRRRLKVVKSAKRRISNA